MPKSLRTITFLLAAFCCGSIFAQSQPSPKPQAKLPPLTPDYKLVWSDDFSKDPDGLPDPTRWVPERGYVRNHERQYYTANRLENARIEHGQLIIEVRKEAYTPPDAMASACGIVWKAMNIPPGNYTSASITTYGKASWTYGRFEIRAKMPKGDVMWPALWTLGTNIAQIGWPRCGEIDLLEMVGANRITGNFHYAINGAHVSSNFGGRMIPTADTDFHTYTLDWTPDRINLYADGIRYTGFDVKKANEAGQNPFHKPHYLIMNLALNGRPIDDSLFPQQLVISYVKVYQKPAPGT